MTDVIQLGSIVELSDINNNMLCGRVIDFKMYRNGNKYNAFVFLEETEGKNTVSEHYGYATVAIDDIQNIKVHEGF